MKKCIGFMLLALILFIACVSTASASGWPAALETMELDNTYYEQWLNDLSSSSSMSILPLPFEEVDEAFIVFDAHAPSDQIFRNAILDVFISQNAHIPDEFTAQACFSRFSDGHQPSMLPGVFPLILGTSVKWNNSSATAPVDSAAFNQLLLSGGGTFQIEEELYLTVYSLSANTSFEFLPIHLLDRNSNIVQTILYVSRYAPNDNQSLLISDKIYASPDTVQSFYKAVKDLVATSGNFPIDIDAL